MNKVSEHSPCLGVSIKKKLKEFSLDVEFETGKGCLGILGPSGCGKSRTSQKSLQISLFMLMTAQAERIPRKNVIKIDRLAVLIDMNTGDQSIYSAFSLRVFSFMVICQNPPGASRSNPMNVR